MRDVARRATRSARARACGSGSGGTSTCRSPTDRSARSPGRASISSDTRSSTLWSPNHALTSRDRHASPAPRVRSIDRGSSVAGIRQRHASLRVPLRDAEPTARLECRPMCRRSAAADDAGDDEQDEHDHEQHERAGPRAVDLRVLREPDQPVDEERQRVLRSPERVAVDRGRCRAAVRSSGAVSPMTRAMPRMTAVTSPARAVGSTTRRAVAHSPAAERERRLRAARRARAAARPRPCG